MVGRGRKHSVALLLFCCFFFFPLTEMTAFPCCRKQSWQRCWRKSRAHAAQGVRTGWGCAATVHNRCRHHMHRNTRQVPTVGCKSSMKSSRMLPSRRRRRAQYHGWRAWQPPSSMPSTEEAPRSSLRVVRLIGKPCNAGRRRTWRMRLAKA